METHDNIDNYRQNHPELIVKDIAGLWAPSPTTIRRILKFRGVNKWLRVRRLLIQLKIKWQREIRQRQLELESLRNDWTRQDEYQFKRGYHKALSECRQQVRALCHSPRDIDFPESASDFGDICKLPNEFPVSPHKKWFYKYNKQKSEQTKKSGE